MGILLPADFPLSNLKNDAERQVVEALRDQLTDGWVVIPNVHLSEPNRDFEIDVVIAHPRDGIAVIEVKGHRPEIRHGAFYADGQRMAPQPLAQARDNAYVLRNRIRAGHPTFTNIKVEYGVVFPNVEQIGGPLPQDADRTQVMTHADLEACREAIDRLMTYRWGQQPLGEVGVERLIGVLLPDTHVDWAAETRARLARQRLEVICDQHIGALQSLDLNHRVCVTGAAGSGKTRLAVRWAGRALLRGERTLLTCFNIPLAARLRERLSPGPHLQVGAFYEVALNLVGMPPLDIPADADRDWWEHAAFGHIHQHWPLVTERFDTIVIDEAQDFSQTWIDLLSQLFDDAGPQRMLMVADPSQGIFARGFRVPTAGWTRCELTANCRNTVTIARMLQHRFNGGEAQVVGPESEDISWVVEEDPDRLVDEVGAAIDRILDERDHTATSMFVGTFRSALRDTLRDRHAMVAWEDRHPMSILCENVHRVKGLEFDHVVLVVDGDEVDDDLLYVGASRAVMSLTVIGPASIVDRFQGSSAPG